VPVVDCGCTTEWYTENAFYCPVTIEGTCGDDVFEVYGKSYLGCETKIGGNLACGNLGLHVLADAQFDCQVTVSGSAFIGNSCNDALLVHATAAFICPVVFSDNVTIGDDCVNDHLQVDAPSEFGCLATFHENVIIGDDCGDNLTVKSESQFDCTVTFGSQAFECWYNFQSWMVLYQECDAFFNTNVTLGEDCGDAIVVKGEASFECNVTIGAWCTSDLPTLAGGDDMLFYAGADPAAVMLRVNEPADFQCDVNIGAGGCYTNLFVQSIKIPDRT